MKKLICNACAMIMVSAILLEPCLGMNCDTYSHLVKSITNFSPSGEGWKAEGGIVQLANSSDLSQENKNNIVIAALNNPNAVTFGLFDKLFNLANAQGINAMLPIASTFEDECCGGFYTIFHKSGIVFTEKTLVESVMMASKNARTMNIVKLLERLNENFPNAYENTINSAFVFVAAEWQATGKTDTWTTLIKTGLVKSSTVREAIEKCSYEEDGESIGFLSKLLKKTKHNFLVPQDVAEGLIQQPQLVCSDTEFLKK